MATNNLNTLLALILLPQEEASKDVFGDGLKP
jgi:hypothetical protein